MSIFDPSHLTLVYGRMGSGKTDLTNLLAFIGRILQQKDHHVLSNINIRKGLGFRHIASDRDYLTYRAELEGPITLILDEANLFQSSKRATQDSAHFLEQLTSIIGHFKTSMIYVIQRRKNLLPFLRELSICEIEKLSKKVAFMKFKGLVFNLKNIPSCRVLGVDYQRESFASWKFETDLEEINHYIASNQMEYEDLIKFLDYHQPEFEKYLLEDEN